ncbi:hypothetical protein ACH4GZ_28380 [Streptomyces hygroscopicus]|uniref:effector-associated constant component EACC1 n=1 Tax=Streptomyces hygroscopicus TaxID=1912 RepID=UPI001C65861A|nr:hypothetical protein [Streptomyces hygroscopicus]
MDVTVAITGTGAADELRSLHQWLIAEEELRGRVRLVESPPPTGTLGSIPQMLAVALAPGGVAAALASVAIAWMRHRTGEVVCKMTRSDGASVEVSAQRVRGTDVAEVRELVAELAKTLDEGPRGTEGPAIDSASSSGQ